MKNRDILEYCLAYLPFLHFVSVFLCDELQLLSLVLVSVLKVFEEFEERLSLCLLKLFEELWHVVGWPFSIRGLSEVEVSERRGHCKLG